MPAPTSSISRRGADPGSTSAPPWSSPRNSRPNRWTDQRGDRPPGPGGKRPLRFYRRCGCSGRSPGSDLRRCTCRRCRRPRPTARSTEAPGRTCRVAARDRRPLCRRAAPAHRPRRRRGPDLRPRRADFLAIIDGMEMDAEGPNPRALTVPPRSLLRPRRLAVGRPLHPMPSARRACERTASPIISDGRSSSPTSSRSRRGRPGARPALSAA